MSGKMGNDLLNTFMNENITKCIITNLPLNSSKKYGKCHSRIIHNMYKQHGFNIEKTMKSLDNLIYVKEYDSFYSGWKGCSGGLSKAKHENVDKEYTYEKYFKEKSKCCMVGCENKVPFDMVTRSACSTLHYNQSNFPKYDRDEARFLCLEDGNRFANLNRLTRHIKSLGVDPKDYYDKYLKISEDEGKCKWCSKDVKFKNVEVGYTNFCHNTNCNVNWHNKFKNRASECAYKISKTHQEGDRLPTQVGYWVKRGYNEIRAKELITERQTTNSVERIMERSDCSLNEATQIRSNITDKWLKSFPKTNFSKVSQKLFTSVYNIIKDDYNEIYFATLKDGKIVEDGKNHEFRVKTEKSSRKLDFYVRDVNKCIEFDGTYWHGVVGRGDKMRDHLRDEEIIDTLKCDIFHVSESDFNKNPDKVIEKCVNFLNSVNG